MKVGSGGEDEHYGEDGGARTRSAAGRAPLVPHCTLVHQVCPLARRPHCVYLNPDICSVPPTRSSFLECRRSSGAPCVFPQMQTLPCRPSRVFSGAIGRLAPLATPAILPRVRPLVSRRCRVHSGASASLPPPPSHLSASALLSSPLYSLEHLRGTGTRCLHSSAPAVFFWAPPLFETRRFSSSRSLVASTVLV